MENKELLNNTRPTEKFEAINADPFEIDTKVVKHFTAGGMGVVATGENEFENPNKLLINKFNLMGAKIGPNGIVDFTPIDEN